MKEISRICIDIEDYSNAYHDLLKYYSITWEIPFNHTFLHYHCHRGNNNPAVIVYKVTNTYSRIFEKMWVNFGNLHRDYGPAIITFGTTYSDIEEITSLWCMNDYNKDQEDIQTWLTEKNIILSRDNDFEIPDEHKVEFKIRFH